MARDPALFKLVAVPVPRTQAANLNVTSPSPIIMIIMMTRLDDAAACRRDGATVTAGGHGAAVPGHPAGESSHLRAWSR